MRIAVLGAGFTGLTASLRLLQMGHQVTLFEKDSTAGGLAGGFKNPNWDWTLEKSYHHIFTSDNSALSLAQELNQKIIFQKPQTDTYINGQILPLDDPRSLMTFPYLSPIDKLRTGLALGYLKLLKNYQKLEGTYALPWIRKYMGKKSAKLIWEPLFTGKFGEFKEDISLTWFWGRVKKRTPTLCYPAGGFQEFANKISTKIISLGGEILLNTEVKNIEDLSRKFDKTIVTLPLPVFLKNTPNLPKKYVQQLSSIPHLSAQVLILILKKPFLKESYWLNINDPGFPFLVLAEHTNFMDPKHYGNQHILYIGNYLPNDHPYLKKSPQELLKIFTPYLKKINPQYPLSPQLPSSPYLFTQPFAQPVMQVGFEKIIPQFKTPLKNIYLANMAMVYPWDRETNYAIEMGEKIAEEINAD
ncbi:MAG: NAD(P)/FAD-dependent oxidoreductase [Candidatus Daviesbacteria bacterium]|nr:NAD(P)/FAD-dependent oxidoreductase [Candidatus Daviesbacteria bacterium]